MKVGALKKLRSECFKCSRCDICSNITNGIRPVCFGRGNVNAKVVFVAQNPGYDEIIQKTPLVGPAGKNFNKLLESIDIMRKEIYISNVVKGRSVDGNRNRDPTEDEVAACCWFLEREIEIIGPELVVALGNFSLKFFTGHGGITAYHGKLERSEKFDVDVIPIFHPSPFNFLNPNRRKMMKGAFNEIKKIIDQNNWRIGSLRNG